VQFVGFIAGGKKFLLIYLADTFALLKTHRGSARVLLVSNTVGSFI